MKNPQSPCFDTRNCEGCAHWRHILGKGSAAMNACLYILDTGKMRGSSVESCTKKTNNFGGLRYDFA